MFDFNWGSRLRRSHIINRVNTINLTHPITARYWRLMIYDTLYPDTQAGLAEIALGVSNGKGAKHCRHWVMD